MRYNVLNFKDYNNINQIFNLKISTRSYTKVKGNSILNKAKYTENTDEWYTDYKTVEDELSHYVDQFQNKIVLCNCDDPYKSAFANYFLKHFNILKLKRLICTSYRGSRIVDEYNS